MNIPTKKKGQGAFEYILLLAGILLIVVLVIVILKGGLLTETQSNVRSSAGISQANARANCLNWCGPGAWKYINSTATGNTSCTDAMLLNSTATTACFWNSTDSGFCPSTTLGGAAAAGTAPQNARACGLFATSIPT